ncbi:MAG TPA: T9SS type A sorting domain-containing protein [Bacteroidia bacterium]|jgi:hypothetical protein|nr:T9SS type A sorting domain-containing protein [Bacteroidia bacterium]
MKKLLFTTCACLIAFISLSQQPDTQIKWTVNSETMPGNIKAFQENKGQFVNTINSWKVLYGCDYQGTRTLFTDHGVIYIIPEKVKTAFNPSDNESRDEEQEKENTKIVLHSIAIEWKNANSGLTVEPIGVTPYYFGSIDPVNSGKSIDNIKGYKKLVFRNVQPGIDVEYAFHLTTGLKYSVTVHPGYSANAFKMQYSGQNGLLIDEKGNLHITTAMGDIIDHAPISSQNEAKVQSSFTKLSQNEMTFDVKNVNTKTDLVIDPWTVSPIDTGFLPSDVVMDSVNNAYILGMEAGGLYLQKYTATGTLAWTYLLTQFGSPGYVSDLAVDPAGNTYIPMPYPDTNSAGKYNFFGLVSLNTLGGVRYFNDTDTHHYDTLFEVWNLVYSRKDSSLIEAGAPVALKEQIGIVKASNGGLGFIFDTAIGEIYSGCIAPNGNYYGLSANPDFRPTSGPGDNVVCYSVNSGMPAFLWKAQTTYNWDDFENKNPNGVSNNSVAAGWNYLYTSDGLNLDQRSLVNGAIIDSVIILNGSNTSSSAVSGIAVDLLCGNVYVGTTNSLLMYDQNLNLLSSVPVPGPVYDVTCSDSIVSVCGGSINGFVLQLLISNCDSIVLGINNLNSIKPTFQVFPNPSSGLFNIKTSYDNNTIVEVYNSLGQFITQKKIMNGEALLDLSAEANGVYCLRILSGSKSSHFNIIVSH